MTMVSTSLAAQLSKAVSLNAPLFADRSRRKPAESYLFTGREVDRHDIASIHALGVNGLSGLKTLDSKFSKYEGNLFSDAARGLDRTLQSNSQNVDLDRIIHLFLQDLGPFLLESPTAKALEWVVRRFRINEFNVDAVMALFLPYHETSHFVKMVSILHVKGSNLWSFLSPLQAAAKPLPKSMLVDEMLNNPDLTRFVVALLPEALQASRTHRTLIGFTTSVTTDYLLRLKRVKEEALAFILPALTRTLAPDSNQDCALAGCVSLATLSQRCRLSPEALAAVVAEMIKGQRHVKPPQLLPFIVAVLAAQDTLDDFPDSATDAIVTLAGFKDTLTDCLSWVGAEKLVLPLLPSLLRGANKEPMGDVLTSLFMSSSVLKPIIERSVQLLLDNTPNRSDPITLHLLTIISQRHGIIYSETTSRLLKTIESKESRKELEAVLHSVAFPSLGANDRGKWILSSNADDVSSRVTAVWEIINALSTDGVESENRQDMYDALQARIMDTNATVIETLYSNPKVILPAFSNSQFIEALSTALAAPGISRTVMRLHFAFITGDLYNHSPDLAPVIFERLYLPYLLFTKPRQRTAPLVWQSLKDSKFVQYELLAGCMDIVYAPTVTDGMTRSIEEMIAVNMYVTRRIAGNMVASSAYPSHMDMLLRLLNGSDAHTINICYLILRSLLSQLSGEHQVDAAGRILSSMRIRSLDDFSDVIADAPTLRHIISDEALLRCVASKPSSVGTMRRLQVAILALLPIVHQPVDAKIDWLGDGALASFDLRGNRYMELARAIYVLANSSSDNTLLSTSLLKALFVNLRERALLFLAGIWTNNILSETESNGLSHAALFHSTAYLQAQAADTDHPMDFQVILPSLLVALQSKLRAARSAAMDCIGIISRSSSSVTGSPHIYALDSVYTSSAELQYVEWLDFGRFISSIDARREHFINDSEYVGVFMQEALGKSRSDNKKESGYKQRILCYILSHAVTWNSVRARVVLLDFLKNVPHRVKIQMLLPLIQSIVPSDQTRFPLDGEGGSTLGARYIELLLEAYDKTAASELNEPGSRSWIVLLRLVRFTLTDDTATSSARQVILKQLCGGLFKSLTMDLKREISIVLVECTAVSPESLSAVKDAMGSLLNDPVLMISLFAHFQPSGKDTSQRVPKRPKLTPDSGIDQTEMTLRPMTALVEILVTQPMPGSVELLSSTLDTLARVFHAHSTQSDANYIMQLLMSILDSIASSIVDNLILTPGTVRMEILVELLRVSDNPQTFNQALLLIANFARLAPEFVMQNVMPVFTFMGSNVFHRDDSYSFRVVQKTVDNIVPVVISSLKAKQHEPLKLQIASRDFLRVFTDAATHVPKHRRTHFFNHLVEILGRDEFAVSICLLLVDKVANKVVRKKPGEAASALSLPLTILQTDSKAAIIKSVEQLLYETMRLFDRVKNPESSAQEAFLEPHLDGDQPSATFTKRQMEAILVFVDLLLQQFSRRGATSDEVSIQESVQLLLRLANISQEPTMSIDLPEVSRIATQALGHVLSFISAKEFASTINAILASSNSLVETGAMNLLASRLANMAPAIRQKISPTISGIVEYICTKLGATQEVSSIKAILRALRAIAETANDQEVSDLMRALPLLLKVMVNQDGITAEVLECVLPMSAKVGPRILPFFYDIVKFCSDALHDVQKFPEGDRPRIEQGAQAVLIALLSSIAQFWSVDELVRLGELSLETRPAFSNMRKTMAKRIPAKQLFPALLRLWSESTVRHSASWDSREVFFDLFKRVLRDATREDVLNHLREIFKLFLEAFDLCGELDRQAMEKFEVLSLNAFVGFVIKLNDAAFKPLYRRLFDWAFNDAAETLVNRQITFSRSLTALIKLLKGLVTPYVGVALVRLTELLDSYRLNRTQSGTLWLSVMELFQASLTLDEGAFWRANKLRTLMPTMVAQVEVCPSFKMDGAQQALKIGLGALLTAMNDEDSIKSLNIELLMQTRSEDAQIRLFALECAEHLWNAHGDKLSGFVSDVVTFIAECADDEHDEVAKAARVLKRTVENKCGNLDVLMQ